MARAPSPRILVVDGDSDVRASLARLAQLQLPGCLVVDVDRVETALQALRLAPFHAVVSDLVLCDGSGFDVLSQATLRHGPLVCLAVTALEVPDLAARLAQVGAVLLRKPVGPASLRPFLEDAAALAKGRVPARLTGRA